MASEKIIVAENLTKRYGDFVAVDSISFAGPIRSKEPEYLSFTNVK